MNILNAHNNLYKTAKAVDVAWKNYHAALDDFGADSPVTVQFRKLVGIAQKKWAKAKKTLRAAEQEREEQLAEMADLRRRQGWLAKALKEAKAS